MSREKIRGLRERVYVTFAGGDEDDEDVVLVPENELLALHGLVRKRRDQAAKRRRWVAQGEPVRRRTLDSGVCNIQAPTGRRWMYAHPTSPRWGLNVRRPLSQGSHGYVLTLGYPMSPLRGLIPTFPRKAGKANRFFSTDKRDVPPSRSSRRKRGTASYRRTNEADFRRYGPTPIPSSASSAPGRASGGFWIRSCRP